MRDASWFERSSLALAAAANESVIVINPVIYAEVSTTFQKIDELDAVLPLDLCRRDNLPYEAAFLAARAFLKYRKRGGSRTSPLPDFFIGAHALVSGYKILTRDPRRFRRYFPDVVLIAP